MALVNDIILSSLRLCGMREDNNVSVIGEAMTALNLMLKSWDEGVLVPTKENFTMTSGTYEYTIGSGGDLDTARPISIIAAAIQDSSGTDYNVEVTLSPIDYSKISDKDLGGRPDKLYYAAEYNSQLGKLYFNKAIESAETLYLTSYKHFTEYSGLEDVIVQPPEYEKAIVYNLAVDLAQEYRITLMPTVIQQAMILKNVIEVRNMKLSEVMIDTALRR